MDYEQKYKNALEEAKKIIEYYKGHNRGGEVSIEDLEGLFPELKETEDEKIRKAILNYFTKCWGNCKDDVCGIHVEDAINWLEKQGEQKSADKLEPKFKVGDWVVFNNRHQSIYQIEKIENGYYILRHTHGGIFRVCVLHDESLRLWTIQDAKDGDVLAEAEDCIFIIRKLGDNLHAAKTYFTLYDDGDFDNGTILNFDADAIHPATEEQRDLLFQKMKEAGYEWDAEKKELKIKLKEPDVYEYELERIVDKLNEVIGKLGDIHQVLSKPYVFPYRDYTPPQEPWYKTHGVEKVTPVTCETIDGLNKSKDNESK